MAGGAKAKLSCRDILATMQPTAGEEFRRTRRRSSIALAVGIVLITGAVLLSIKHLAPDVLTTVAGIAGVFAISYGLIIQVTALLNNREPDE